LEPTYYHLLPFKW